MAAYLKSGQFLTIFRSHKNFSKLFTSVSWSTFNEMPLEARLVDRLNALRITALTEIQQKSLGLILNGDNVIINAETGSGKTLCYLVPVVDRLLKKRPSSLSTVILVPNMDLGYQVTDLVNKLCDPGLYACPLHRDSQLRINHKYPIIVSTPQTLMQYNIKSLTSIQTIIIDEADLIISNGGKRFWKLLQSFQDCLNLVKNGHVETSMQFIFAAATLPCRGERSVFRGILNRFPNINHITSTNVHHYVPSLTNVSVFVKEEMKLPQLVKCLNILNGDLAFEHFENFQDFEIRKKFTDTLSAQERKADVGCMNFGIELHEDDQVKGIKVLVFANTVSMAKNAYEFLNYREGSNFKMVNRALGYKEPNNVPLQNSVVHQFYKNYIKTTAIPNNEEFVTKTGPTYSWRNRVGILHKEMSRSERQEVLTKFRGNEIVVLVSTDLAARGLDICDISHVIQVDYARNAADTLHRAGRTARAGNPGTVISFVTENDKDLWRAIKLTERGIGSEGFQEIFSRNRQFSRRIKKRMSHIDR